MELLAPAGDLEKLKIALPEVVVPAFPGSSLNQRLFSIRAENDMFIPKEIIANEGDIISLKFTAVDKEYDLIFPSENMMIRAKQGETKSMQFGALQSGSFSFYCSLCGGPEKGPKGKFIIVQP
jgi:hypothetical protein